jgi:hypothetical protein
MADAQDLKFWRGRFHEGSFGSLNRFKTIVFICQNALFGISAWSFWKTGKVSQSVSHESTSVCRTAKGAGAGMTRQTGRGF